MAAPASAAPSLTLSDGKSVAAIVYDTADSAPIAKAAELLAHDLKARSGFAPVIATHFNGPGPAILIGRSDSPLIASLLKANKIDTAPLAGKWETYGRAVVPAPWNPQQSVLVIFGSDTRGTIWGVIDLTREIGVSAWEWWADVKILKADRIAVDAALRTSKEPSVKYRGIFLNDEEYGLFPWASMTYDPKLGNIGPKTYARIYELMWRLKANTFWPAMHTVTEAFNKVPGNPEMADAYAMIHASSHVEMMLRSNPREWDEKTMGPYNFVTNRENMLKYWDEAVQKFGKYENVYTVGLRGADDYPMAGADTPQGMARILEDVFAEQRKILSNRLGKPADQIPQVFTPYKEVLPAYDAGLKVPDDVTLAWPDDNFGYIRRLSNAEERKRAGGAGVYYHISYWGGPMSYLWLASTHPALLWEEMNKAYRFEARRYWILNVGDIKPGEYLTQLFMDIGFDAEAFPDPASVRAHLKNWAAENFGAANADEIADIMWRTYDLAFGRNPEFMAWSTAFPETAVSQTKFNMLDFGDENARRAEAYRAVMASAQALAAKLPDDLKPAYYQLVQYPVEAAGNMNIRQLSLDKTITYGLQRRESANSYSAEAKRAQATIEAGAHYYNNVMLDGKWRGMMGIRPHDLPAYDSPHLPVWDNHGDKSCGWQTEGGGYFAGGGWPQRLATFQRAVPRQRYLDFFVTGPVAANWTLKPTVPWITLSQSSGSLGPQRLEQRVWIGIDWAKAPDGATAGIVASCGETKAEMPITVRTAPANTVKDVSFLEDNGIVSIYAVHADEKSDGWEVLDGLGHTGASLRSDLGLASVDAGNPAAIAKAPHVTYRFATATKRGYDLVQYAQAKLRVIALPILPITSDNGMRVAVSVDGGPAKVLDFYAAEFTEPWRQHVLTNAAVETVNALDLKPGAHTLTVYALDPGVILDRFEIAFDEAPRAYGPVPETRIAQ
ncbi:MAG TPA: glycosyl hydrolase 115 family protein [Rhizomicrobium sp.]